ncbi:sugar kinase [Sphingopyxis sp. RIFCSPHIGHO2_12_FULL_65_19]|uniref:sugar kinase n=1 Tax=Sphingopyxis sp. RIFCSPHIGHO2_12_FULL_65_19 TaxID=1802172 RepID=UPI0008D14559|nr:sugar kinase [Sphingopyxis sp. RIFCSPHIGHO2_12_FULL_65_19]OHD07842.1 MAG: 2-keto-3-deoxygluconate kinase [Sphingopyxis sp. RIFCSPHIGHO2_12_FULL_65_19]
MIDPTKTIACFGEVVLRLGVPHGELPLQSARFEVHVGGAEANVAVALASLGHDVTMLSAIPGGALGDGVVDRLRGHGVDTRRLLRPAGRMGLYYHLPGGPMRADDVQYDRAHTAFAALAAADWDWDRLLEGVGWLHLSGVTPALGPRSADAALEAVRRARAAGIGVSFDGNWRGRLWERWHDDPAAVLRPIVAEASLLFGNHRDASLLLGRDFSGDGAERRREAALALLDAFPKLDRIASTARRVIEPARHELRARIDTRDDQAQTRAVVITPVIDRIGTGDAFAAGILDACLAEKTLAATAQNGLSAAAIAHGLKGDFAPLSRYLLAGASPAASDVAR